MTMTTERSAEEIRAEIARVPRWRHSIEVAPGISTPGDPTKRVLRRLHLPQDLTGKSVLDVGCSDGFFSFEAEKRGAGRVVGFDEWSSPFVDRPAGFDTVHRLLNSKVEFHRLDLQTLDPTQLGQFDIVLCLGVLYHLKHPLLGIEQLRKLTKDMLILETEVTESIVNTSGMRFIEGLYHGRDITTWWVPSVACVMQMARAAGFQRVETITLYDTRAVFHCFKDAGILRKNILSYRPDELAEVLPPEKASAAGRYVQDLSWDELWDLEQQLVWNRSSEIAQRTRAIPVAYGAYRRILALFLDALRAAKLRYR
jgi:tRNA (mo5U34)-methyltransferase